jgi:superkiller protein 3
VIRVANRGGAAPRARVKAARAGERAWRIILALALSAGLVGAGRQAGEPQARAVAATPRVAPRQQTFSTARAALASPARAAPLAAIDQVSDGVTVQHTGQVTVARPFMPLFGGDDLRTARGQQAAIVLRDGSRVRLNENTDLQIGFPVLYLHRGEIDCTIVHSAQRRVVVRTNAAVAAVLGTQFDVVAGPPGSKVQTVLTVVQGTVQLSNSLGSVLVRAGEQATANPDSAPTQPVETDARRAAIWTTRMVFTPIISLPPHYPTPRAAAAAAGRARARLAQHPLDVAAHLVLAGTLADGGDAAGALAEYRRALALAPATDKAARVAAETGIAAAAFAAGDLEQADAAAAAALALDPGAMEAGLLRGDVALSRDDVAGAVAAAQTMQRRFPQDPQPLLALGIALMAQHQDARAATALNAALRLHPPAWLASDALVYLGGLAALRADLTEALAYYERAVEVDPRFATAWNNIGFALNQLGRYAEAIGPLEHGARFGSPFERSLAELNLAETYYVLGKYPPMVQAVLASAALNPTGAIGYYFASWAEGSLGRWREALAYARRAVSLDPQNTGLQGNYCGYLAVVRPVQAEATCRAALRVSANDPNLYVYLGRVLSNEGRTQEARAAYERAYALRPGMADDLTADQAGTIALQAGHMAEAVADLRRATALRPGNYQYWVGLAGALQAAGDARDALAAATRALAINPDGIEAHVYLAQAFRRLGNDARAASEDRAALRLNPHGPFMHQDLAAIAQHKGDLTTARDETLREIGVLDEPDNRALYNDGNLLSGQWQTLARIYTALHQPRAALNAALHAVAAAPGNPWAHDWLGAALERQGNYRAARDQYAAEAALLKGKPGEAVALTALGRMLYWLEAYTQAISVLRRAVAADPRSTDAHAWLGLLLLDTGQPTAARAQFATVARLNPHYGDIYYWLGLADRNMGQTNRAVAELNRQVALDAGKAQTLTYDLRALGLTYGWARRWREAADAYARVVGLGYATDQDYYNLGYAQNKMGTAAALASLLKARDLARAAGHRQIAQQACELLATLGHPCNGQGTATPVATPATVTATAPAATPPLTATATTLPSSTPTTTPAAPGTPTPLAAPPSTTTTPTPAVTATTALANTATPQATATPTLVSTTPGATSTGTPAAGAYGG